MLCLGFRNKKKEGGKEEKRKEEGKENNYELLPWLLAKEEKEVRRATAAMVTATGGRGWKMRNWKKDCKENAK